MVDLGETDTAYGGVPATSVGLRIRIFNIWSVEDDGVPVAAVAVAVVEDSLLVPAFDEAGAGAVADEGVSGVDMAAIWVEDVMDCGRVRQSQSMVDCNQSTCSYVALDSPSKANYALQCSSIAIHVSKQSILTVSINVQPLIQGIYFR